MNAVTLEAHFDGRQICLDEPYELRTGMKLVVLVLPTGMEAPRDEWYGLGRRSLARACDDDEPDYSDLLGQPPAAK